MTSKTVLSPTRDEENKMMSPETDKKEPSPEKKSKLREKYAGVGSKVQSGLAMKPPVPNFAANRAKREAA